MELLKANSTNSTTRGYFSLVYLQLNHLKQASLSGHSMTIGQKRSFKSQLGPQFFFLFFFLRRQVYQMLGIVPSCNLVQYQGKLMTQPWKDGKNCNFEPNLGPKNFSHGFYLYQQFNAGFTSTSSQALLQAIILCNLKEN